MQEQDKIKKSAQKMFQCAGSALFVAQLMEKELAFLLLIPEMKIKQKSPSKEDIKKAIEELNKMTFGTLVRKLKETANKMNITSEDLLQEALDERNFLAHHFFDAYQGKLDDLKTHEIMRKRLLNMKEIFTEIFDGLHEENLRIMKVMGV
jgi:arsenate reductase-like glutaredoxin family protein